MAALMNAKSTPESEPHTGKPIGTLVKAKIEERRRRALNGSHTVASCTTFS